MSKLNKLQNEINKALRDIGLKDSVLESLGKSKEFKLIVRHFRQGIEKQLDTVIDEELFATIKSAIGKADDIWTESDSLEVQDAVNKKMKKHPIIDFVSDVLIASYLLYVFNKGGQNFLDKKNIPAEFELTNEPMITSIESEPATIFSGMDETTSKWISDQIIAGKSGGLSTDEIVDGITDSIPDLATYRANTIVRTETAKYVGQAEHVTAVKNGASHKSWQTADDDRVSDECMANEDEGVIGIQEAFVSGASYPPQHPNCRCVVDYKFTPFQGTIWNGQ